MHEELKAVKDVFGDYKENSSINQCKIEKINLFKKTNKIELDLFSNIYIKAKELLEFENYLKTRFNIENVEIDINYDETVELPKIETAWKSIVDYVCFKHPSVKALLANSDVHVQDNIVTVRIFVNGVEFLNARGFDKILESTLKCLFGKQYKVKYIEDINEDEIQKIEQKSKMTEKYEIEKAISEAMASIEEEKESKEENIQESEETTETIEEEKEEKTPLILGRNANIKENIVKVEDISIDSGKIALEGEIINTDSRELKSGKFLVMFDLYDGTSTITCKAFVEAEKVRNVLSRLKDAKGVKISGTAQFDPFAKELRSNF